MYTNKHKHKMQGKTPDHRESIIKSQILELIRAKRIKTTPSKAKIIKAVFDRLVTKAKKENEAGNNYVRSFFNSNERAVVRLNKLIKENLNDRVSGYTRVIKTLPRKGDNAEQVYIMLVNYSAEAKKSRLQTLVESRTKKESKKKVN